MKAAAAVCILCGWAHMTSGKRSIYTFQKLKVFLLFLFISANAKYEINDGSNPNDGGFTIIQSNPSVLYNSIPYRYQSPAELPLQVPPWLGWNNKDHNPYG